MKWFRKSKLSATDTTSTTKTVSFEAITDARERLKETLPITPCTFSHTLSELTNRYVFLKWDNKLKTGSFKERGVLNFLLSTNKEELRKGVCAASAGNHALALARHSKLLDIKCTLVMPERAPVVKVAAAKRYGAKIILHGNAFSDAYDYARQVATDEGLVFVPAYDHELIIAGQGVAGLELLDQTSDLDAIVVPVGGGGYISGIARAVKELSPNIKIIGVQSDWTLKQRQATIENTTPSKLIFHSLADGIAVKNPGIITQQMIEKYVDELVSVSENEIADGIICCLEQERAVIEGAGAAGIAALIAGKLNSDYRNIAIMLCGSNIDMNVLSGLIDRNLHKKGRVTKIITSVPDRPGSLAFLCSILAASRANVIEAIHNRSFSQIPGNVDISFLLEVRDLEHKDVVLTALRNEGIDVREET